jgi:putative SOS response-associated peptidase YedK
MCGRFSLVESKEDLEVYFKVKIPNDYKPRYNASPSQLLPVILNDEPDTAQMVRWGLLPSWIQKKRSDGLINVRAETLREKSTFKADLEKRRCLILANGFYEWQKTDDGKQPYRIVLKDKRPFAFAGIWEVNHFEGKEIKTFAIITTTPNSVLLPIHTRMPVLLTPGDERKWLEEPDLSLLNPFSAEKMEAYKVGVAVNNARNESPTLIKPVL